MQNPKKSAAIVLSAVALPGVNLLPSSEGAPLLPWVLFELRLLPAVLLKVVLLAAVLPIAALSAAASNLFDNFFSP